MFERLFGLSARGTTVGREVGAGFATFLTLSYILFVQPAVLSAAGMNGGAVLVATCVASAVACLVMGLAANYPIALAPAMGHNFYFAYMVCGAVSAGGLGFTWQEALAANLLAGVVFLLLSLVAFRQKLMERLPRSLVQGIAVGIGLMISFIGLQWSGLVVASPGTMVALGDLGSRPVLVSLLGLLVIGVGLARRFRGAILLGILVSAAASLVFGLTAYHGIAGPPPSVAPTFLQLDLSGLFTDLPVDRVLTVVFIFFFLDLFDTLGTLVGVAGQSGLLRNGKLERAREAFLADATGTVSGALLGTSTVTSYVESSAGVAAGGRTGLTTVTVAGLFLLSIFFAPLVATVGQGVEFAGTTLRPAIAPVLIVVGAFLTKGAGEIQWDDPTEAIPAFLTLIVIPFSVSITEGIAFGFIAASILKTIAGRRRELHWVIHLFAGLFVLRFLFLR